MAEKDVNSSYKWNEVCSDAARYLRREERRANKAPLSPEEMAVEAEEFVHKFFGPEWDTWHELRKPPWLQIQSPLMDTTMGPPLNVATRKDVSSPADDPLTSAAPMVVMLSSVVCL